MSKARVFGPDQNYQLMTSRPHDEWTTITRILRDAVKGGTDITIVLGPFGDRDPYDFPYVVKSDLYREPPTGGES